MPWSGCGRLVVCGVLLHRSAQDVLHCEIESPLHFGSVKDLSDASLYGFVRVLAPSHKILVGVHGLGEQFSGVCIILNGPIDDKVIAGAHCHVLIC